jgi:hypothetical protein
LKTIFVGGTFPRSLDTTAVLVARWSNAPAVGTIGHAKRSAVAGLRASITLTAADGKLGLGLEKHILLLLHAQQHGLHLLGTGERWIGGKRLGESGVPTENESDGQEQQVFGH